MRLLGLLLLPGAWQALLPGALPAQEWDSPRVTSLVARATARRARAEASEGLQRWQATARGMVLFLTQVGDAASAPRLVKADELAVEVYWEAPGRSKQTIVAWRDRTWLPTDIRYHRDHLGIVANDFGPRIRIGEGDEVRDVPHPLSAEGRPTYHFALVDSVTVTSGDREWQVFAVRVRPRDPVLPGVVGTLYLDRESAALVRFQFSFTASAYREAALEDITVVLENALQAGGYWLPWRQEIEIRRGTSFVDLPVRGIIRGHWELSEHRLGADAAAAPAIAAEIGGLRAPGGAPDAWEGALEDHLDGVLHSRDRGDFESLRQELWRELDERFRRIAPPVQPAFGSVSEVVRFNRVEGLRVGAGAELRLPVGDLTAEPWLGVALATGRTSGRLSLGMPLATHTSVRLGWERAAVDVGHAPVISPVLNSMLAQEFGADRGDWGERGAASIELTHASPGGTRIQASLTREDWRPLGVATRPATGSFRANPAFEDPPQWSVRARTARQAPLDAPSAAGWDVAVEHGLGSRRYLRVLARGEARWTHEAGSLRLAGSGGWGSGGLPSTRGFVLGGWGTLPGTPFRGFGGRRFALARVEWLARMRIPGITLGSFPPVQSELLLGPFIAAGITAAPLAETPWPGSGGIRPVAGIAAEGIFGLLRLEAGWDLRGGRFGLQGDLASSWWGVL